MAKSKPAEVSCAREGEHMSIDIRKIANGYIVRHSKDGPKGYESSETYHDKKPNLNLAAVRAAATGKPKPRSV